jgi:hypothetical protein
MSSTPEDLRLPAAAAKKTDMLRGAAREHQG